VTVNPREDQAAAAAAHAHTIFDAKALAGDRYLEATFDDLPEPVQALLEAHWRATDEARGRYERATPETEHVEGRTSWQTCPHSRPGAAPPWWLPVLADVLFCEDCAAGLAAVPHCMRCGTEDNNLTTVTVPAGPVLLVASLCDTCYPEAAELQ
jgi:hypothetical protein